MLKKAYSHTSKTGMEKRLAALFDIEIHFQTQFWEDWKMLKFFSCLFLLHLASCRSGNKQPFLFKALYLNI